MLTFPFWSGRLSSVRRGGGGKTLLHCCPMLYHEAVVREIYALGNMKLKGCCKSNPHQMVQIRLVGIARINNRRRPMPRGVDNYFVVST